jgi:hypothetical protein
MAKESGSLGVGGVEFRIIVIARVVKEVVTRLNTKGRQNGVQGCVGLFAFAGLFSLANSIMVG